MTENEWMTDGGLVDEASGAAVRVYGLGFHQDAAGRFRPESVRTTEIGARLEPESRRSIVCAAALPS
jgi:hypothetical protein